MRIKELSVLVAVLLILTALPAAAYVGPGAGFAVVSSMFMILGSLLLSMFSLLIWPIRRFLKSRKRKASLKRSKTGRVIVLGLDGLSPSIIKKLMGEGKLPNFAKLQEMGTFKPLSTTVPAISPVAWSSFQTGVNPARHNIFDFLSRDKRTYLPDLSSARIGAPKKTIKLGKWAIPIGKADIKSFRKSKSFWSILGDNGILSNVLRVPITFPAEKFDGVMLSAMCVPDLLGTQGTFVSISTREGSEEFTGGRRVKASRNGDGTITFDIPGPYDPLAAKTVEMKIAASVKTVNDKKNGTGYELKLGGKKYKLKPGEYSDWLSLEYKGSLGMKVKGIGRFLILATEPEFEMYLTPVNIDPDDPALPVSHPKTYSVYLSKLYGPYATLGLAEDTWALNERVIDEAAFWTQAWNIFEERRSQFLDALRKTKTGLVTCVFDTSDRIQHTFWRYLDDDHPANAGKDTTEFKDAIERMYYKMDELVGETMAEVDLDNEILIVMSDHGFGPFKRCVNINGWLAENGYLFFKNDKNTGADFFADVDWGRTKAFAVGLGGIYFNRKGREARGIVSNEEAIDLRKEIAAKLTATTDPKTGDKAVRTVYDMMEQFKGPYAKDGPDLFVGFYKGWRASWETVTGNVPVGEDVFADNTKAWSGDHCVASEEVPGIFFCNRKVAHDYLHITDIAATVLDLFGVDIPGYIEGKPVGIDISKREAVTEAKVDETKMGRGNSETPDSIKKAMQ
ncbi:MAG: nucleotide pyrophosphatase [bacterium]|nr:nucleotide pyrophosphatase [bacterium]